MLLSFCGIGVGCEVVRVQRCGVELGHRSDLPSSDFRVGVPRDFRNWVDLGLKGGGSSQIAINVIKLLIT